MDIYNLFSMIFDQFPDFKEYVHKEDKIDPNYYNSFLGEFGLFVRDAIIQKKDYASNILIFISDIYNQSFHEKDFINMMNVNILEVLTDYKITQERAVIYFEENCLDAFKNMLNSYFFNNLLDEDTNNSKVDG